MSKYLHGLEFSLTNFARKIRKLLGNKEADEGTLKGMGCILFIFGPFSDCTLNLNIHV